LVLRPPIVAEAPNPIDPKLKSIPAEKFAWMGFGKTTFVSGIMIINWQGGGSTNSRSTDESS
jgi:hypothetical protein